MAAIRAESVAHVSNFTIEPVVHDIFTGFASLIRWKEQMIASDDCQSFWKSTGSHTGFIGLLYLRQLYEIRSISYGARYQRSRLEFNGRGVHPNDTLIDTTFSTDIQEHPAAHDRDQGRSQGLEKDSKAWLQ